MKSFLGLIFVIAAVGFATGCATTLHPENSAAYQDAVDHAFADMKARSADRQPASTQGDQLATVASQQFSKTQYFEVVAYPKIATFSKRDRDPMMKVTLGEPVTFQYRIDRQGHCALGSDVVSPQNQANCVQVEIKPMTGDHSKQFVRVFMTPDYRVYGVSYHDLNPNGSIQPLRKVVKWDSTEPLSSDLLSLKSQFIPLDIPAHASNGLKLASAPIKINAGARAGEVCNGWKINYKNTFGAFVKTGWCSSDPWPTIVETDRYMAVLNTKAAVN